MSSDSQATVQLVAGVGIGVTPTDLIVAASGPGAGVLDPFPREDQS